MPSSVFDVVVIGAGHAGIEAACAAARMGCKTALITKSIENLGEMSCNPAIGGVAKGTIVREVDALDGVMGTLIDQAGIHFRILNASKGAAVHSPRAQADRKLYKKAARELLQNYPNLEIIYGSAEDIELENGEVKAVILSHSSAVPSHSSDILSHSSAVPNHSSDILSHSPVILSESEGSHNVIKIKTKSAVLTTGTFLRGVIHIGDKTTPAGRVGETPSYGLSYFLERLEFDLARLKTGTPARILKSSIDFSQLEKQPSDAIPQPFSYLNDKIDVPQIDCYITYTTPKTHEIIKENLQKSAMYGGHIASLGPRYCPSIEDKINRFFDKERHQVFLEPEGLDSDLIYPNGLSTSLPLDVQIEFLKSIPGLENCHVTQAGYAIEYDFVDPRQLLPTLETKKVRNLFFAGQINGTTGYEEAAGQGIIAGINAALKAKAKNCHPERSAKVCHPERSAKVCHPERSEGSPSDEFILDRASSYIGVMIDDLTTLGTKEPYRMLTSRAEYRLNLRADNADFRLTELANKFGIIGEKRNKIFTAKKEKIDAAKNILQNLKISPTKLTQFNITVKQDGVVRTAYELLGFQSIDFAEIEKIWPEISSFEEAIKKQIKIDASYKSYIKKQEEDIEIFRQDQNMKIPLDIDYYLIQSLSNEVREKLSKARPANIAAAFKISGITPASIMAVMIYIKNRANKKPNSLKNTNDE